MTDSFIKSKEFITFIIFVVVYVFIRIIEIKIIPCIPIVITREISALCRVVPILIPILFGFSMMSKTSSSSSTKNYNIPDNILKERMMLWTK